MTIAKSLVAGIATGLLAAGSLAAWRSPSPETREKPSTSHNHISVSSLHSRKSVATDRWSVPVPATSVDEVFGQVQRLLEEPDNEITRQRIRGLLQALPASEFGPLLELVESQIEKRWMLSRVLPELARAWSDIDPTAALEGLQAVTTKGRWRKSKLITEAFRVWTRQSPEEAQSWLVANQNNPAYAESMSDMIAAVASGLAGKSGDLVIEWAAAMDGEEGKRAALSALWTGFTKAHQDRNCADETTPSHREILQDRRRRTLVACDAQPSSMIGHTGGTKNLSSGSRTSKRDRSATTGPSRPSAWTSSPGEMAATT